MVLRISISNSDSQSQIIAVMNPFLFDAAVKGKVEPFKGKLRKELEQIVTKISKDTILHINIKSGNQKMFDTDDYIKSKNKQVVSVFEFVEQILNLCPSLLLQANAKGDIPLHIAAKCGNSDMVKVLIQCAKAQRQELESGQRVDLHMLKMTNDEKNTALHEAVIHDREDVVEMLTEDRDYHFSYSANKFFRTPLYLAAARGSFQMVGAILKTCTDSASYEGPVGKTALHAAVMSKSPEIIKEIFKKKNELTKEVDKYGWTPLHYAAYYGLNTEAESLLTLDESAAFIANDDPKMTSLHMAAAQGHMDVIKKFLLHSPECYDMADGRGWNFLHYAMVSLKDRDVDILLNESLVRSLIYEKDKNGNTPLHVLAATNQYSIYKVLGKKDILHAIIAAGRSSICEGIIDKWFKGEHQALNNQNFSVKDITRHNNINLDEAPALIKEDIQNLTKVIDKEQYPKGVIRLRNAEVLEEPGNNLNERIFDLIADTRNAELVVATLVATVTFAAAFTMPGGYRGAEETNQGTALLIKKLAFQVFIVTNTVSMITSLSALVIYFITAIANSLLLCTLTYLLLVSSIISMVIASVTGTYVVLEPSSWLALANSFLCASVYIILFVIGRKIVLKFTGADGSSTGRQLKVLYEATKYVIPRIK